MAKIVGLVGCEQQIADIVRRALQGTEIECVDFAISIRNEGAVIQPELGAILLVVVPLNPPYYVLDHVAFWNIAKVVGRRAKIIFATFNPEWQIARNIFLSAREHNLQCDYLDINNTMLVRQVVEAALSRAS